MYQRQMSSVEPLVSFFPGERGVELQAPIVLDLELLSHVVGAGPAKYWSVPPSNGAAVLAGPCGSW